jgi:hypothetical protein
MVVKKAYNSEKRQMLVKNKGKVMGKEGKKRKKSMPQ